MSFHIRNDKGFSLIETMVATFLFALVSAAGVMLLSGYQNGRTALSVADDRIAQVTLAREVIKADLMAAIDRPVRLELGGAQGFTGSGHLPDGLKLRLVREGSMRAVLDGAATGLERVDYVLESGALIRRTFPRTDNVAGAVKRDRVLLSGIKDLSLRFESDGQWRDEWLPAVALEPLPNLAAITLDLENGRRLRFLFMVGAQA